MNVRTHSAPLATPPASKAAIDEATTLGDSADKGILVNRRIKLRQAIARRLAETFPDLPY